MDLITEVVEEEIPLASMSITFEGTEDEIEEWRLANYPDWVVLSAKSDEGFVWEIELQENPELKKFEFVVNGMKFGRTIATTSPEFDARAFWLENEDLEMWSKK